MARTQHGRKVRRISFAQSGIARKVITEFPISQTSYKSMSQSISQSVSQSIHAGEVPSIGFVWWWWVYNEDYDNHIRRASFFLPPLSSYPSVHFHISILPNLSLILSFILWQSCTWHTTGSPTLHLVQSNPLNLSLWAILLIWIIDMQDLYAYTTTPTNTIQLNSSTTNNHTRTYSNTQYNLKP